MFPYFTLFGSTYPVYSLLGLAAMFVGTALARTRAKGFGLTGQDIIFAAAFAGMGLLIGGVFLYALVQIPVVAANWQGFLRHLPASLTVFAGMVFYGGLAGAVTGLWVYSKMMKQSFAALICLAVPVMPLVHGIMRLGCFAGGCCYGIPHEGWGIAFTRSPAAPNNIPLLPVQLYEAGFNFLLFALLWPFSREKRNAPQLLCIYGLAYGIGRFFLEFLRGDAHRGFVFGLSTSQFISLLVVAICSVGLAKRIKM